MQENIQKIKSMIREIPNFPKEGILFRDITTALKDADTLKLTVDEIYEAFKDEKIDYIAGIESRGFIYGMPLAYKLGCGFIPVRKPNKLPRETVEVSYDLEYGSNTLCIHKDSVKPGQKVVIIDDLLATGGTVEATVKLVEKLGGKVVGCAFLIELVELHGRDKLAGIPVKTLLAF